MYVLERRAWKILLYLAERNISFSYVLLEISNFYLRFLTGTVAIKCYECNSKLDPRCGEPFNNFTIALVDCEQQRKNDIPHLDDHELGMFNRKVDAEGQYVEEVVDKDEKPKSFCRKTLQTSK